MAVMGGGRYGVCDIEEADPREMKKASARKTAAYVASKKAKNSGPSMIFKLILRYLILKRISLFKSLYISVHFGQDNLSV